MLFCEIELFHQQPLQFHHDDVVWILELEVVEEWSLWLLVSSKKKCNTYKESLLKYLVIIHLLQMLAQELDAANVHQAVLLGIDDLLILSPFLTIPVSWWRRYLFVFNFDNFPQQGKAGDVQILGQAFRIKQRHERADDGVVTHVRERLQIEVVAAYPGLVCHDVVDSQVDVSHPQNKGLKLSLLLLDHVFAESKLDQFSWELAALLAWFIVHVESLVGFVRWNVNVLVCWVLHIFEKVWILLWVVDER